jgi:class 3 adenylate cyclase
MELNIKYAKTADGVKIAYGTAGAGSPLVRVPNPPFSHCQREWRESAFYGRLSEGRMVVTFDPRGTGLSDRQVADYSLDARVLDLEAVVDRLGLQRFALNGTWYSGLVVIAYAARYPERVTHLVLDDAIFDARAAARLPQMRAFRELAEDWEAMTENIAFAVGGVGGDIARRAEFMRACTTQDAARRMFAAFDEEDVTELLPRVQAPTLILQHVGMRASSPDAAREMATLIPDAHLVMLDGKETDDLDHVISAMADFLGDGAGATATAPAVQGGLRTILFTDIVGHTEMMQRLGDGKGRDVLREHERITRETLKQHSGAEVKTMGDGFMASFGSVTSAMDCAIALQRAFHGQNQEPGTENLNVRVGLNAGEPIEEDGDLFGATVILASRIAAKAGAGEILIPEPVRHLLSGKSFAFSDRGEFAMKGFDDAVRLYEVRWQE